MGIDGINQPPARPTTDAVSEQAAVRRTERQQVDQAAGAREATGGDAVELSSRGKELARAQQAVEAAPDVRADKVAEIKKQIEDGTYNVPAEDLARKLLGDQ